MQAVAGGKEAVAAAGASYDGRAKMQTPPQSKGRWGHDGVEWEGQGGGGANVNALARGW